MRWNHLLYGMKKKDSLYLDENEIRRRSNI